MRQCTPLDAKPRARRLNLKLPDALHARLKMEAARQRTTLQRLVLSWLEERLSGRAVEAPEDEAARQAAIDLACGFLKNAPGSLDAFLEERHQETLREEQREREM